MDGFLSQAVIRSDMKNMREQMLAAQLKVAMARIQKMVPEVCDVSTVEPIGTDNADDGWWSQTSAIEQIATMYTPNALEELAETYA